MLPPTTPPPAEPAPAPHDRALIRAVDSIQLYTPDLEAALRFYRDALGQGLVWRTDTAAGLSLPDQQPGELVLQTERPPAAQDHSDRAKLDPQVDRIEVDLLVDEIDNAVTRFVSAGGRLIDGPFPIQVGRAAVVEDPFANRFLLLDMSKGRLTTDEHGVITGNDPPSGPA